MVTLGHVPACAFAGVVDAGLRSAAILVVAEGAMPGNHEFGVAVNEFVVGHPERVVHGAHALEVMDIAGRHDALHVDRLAECRHGFRNGLLVVIAVAPEVVGEDNSHGALHCLPVLLGLRYRCERQEEKEYFGK